MAGTTTNNSWDYPTSTDLVTNGALAIQTLADEIDTSVGAGLKAWVAWTPTISGTGWVKGSGTVTGRYCKIGKTVHFEINYLFSTAGSGAAGSAALTFDLPVNGQTTISPNYMAVQFLDSSASQGYLGIGSLTSTGVSVFAIGAGGTYATVTSAIAGVPFTWATGDEVRVNGTYECV
jgi:hypothetical protein